MKKLFVFLTLGLFVLACSITSSTSSPASPAGPSPAPVVQASSTLAPITPTAASPFLMPSRIWMMDPTTGWGLAEWSTQSEINTHLLRTIDSGGTWHDISPTAKADQFFALDSTRAWVLVPENSPVNGTLYRTSNGGKTWQSFSVPFGQGSLQFLDINEGWAIYNGVPWTQAIPILLFHTSDGGANWTQMPVNERPGYSSSFGVPGGMVLNSGQTLTFSRNAIWIVSDLDYPVDIPSLYVSWDNGKKWQGAKLSLPAFINAKKDPLGFEHPIFMTDTLAYLPLIVNDTLSIFVSNDGGRSWSLRKNTVKNVKHFTRVDFVSELDAFVLCGENVCVTHDGAQTWQTVKTNFGLNPQIDYIVKLDFVNTTIGWALVSHQNGEITTYTLLKSTDGGATWTILGK
ncbi:MAG: hypothetical protein M1485_04535 [Chloroflexi bacterium]|nr:hypothetical protein [Chloroflexota bacterium]